MATNNEIVIVPTGAASGTVARFDGSRWQASTVATALSAVLTTRGDTFRRGASAVERLALPTVGGQPALLGSDGTDLTAIGGKFSCRAETSSATSVANTTFVAIALNGTDAFDNGALHDPSTNNTRLTAPVAGRYLQIGHINYNTAGGGTGIRQANCRLNGSTYVQSATVVPHGTNDINVNCGTVWDLAANDYVELVAYQNSGGSIDCTGECALVLLAGV